MVSISGFSGQNGLTQLTASETSATTLSGPNFEHSFDSTAMGDLVDISDEARELLATKMAEFDAETPEDLTSDERDEIRDALEDTDGVTDRDIEIIGGGGPGGPGEAGEGEEMSAQRGQGKGSGEAGAAQDSTDSSDDVENLEDEIAQLESEIEKLQAKSSSDEDAKNEIKVKQVELASMQAELTLLTQESA